MSGAGLIELLAARLGGRGVRRASPSLREALVDLSARSAEPGVAGQEEALRQAYGRLSMEMPTENLRLPTSRVSLDDLPDVGPGWRDKDKVAHYADLLAQSEPPPIMIARDARNGAWDVIDGNHRLEVMRAAGRREIPAMDATGAFKGRYVSSDAMPPKAAPRRTGPDAGPSQAGRTPSNVSVSITNRGGLRQIDWDLKDGSESFSLAHRAAAEREGIDAAVAAFDADIVRHPNARYYIEPITRALARRYRRMAGERGFAMEPHGNGYILSRTAPDGGPLRDGPNAGSDRNALQRALRDRMNRE